MIGNALSNSVKWSETQTAPDTNTPAPQASRYQRTISIQSALHGLDYYHWDLDGMVGPGTRRAISI